MKHLCKALTMLLLTVLVGLSGLTAYAHDVPDESKKGSITVDFEYDNKAVTGGRLALYRIAKVRQTDGNYDFENLPEFAGFHKDMSDLTSAELARCLADFVDGHSIQPVDARDNKTGSVTFPELLHGLYLVVQAEEASGYEAVQPFLVTVPMLEDGRYVYDVNAYGKTALQKTKTDPSGTASGGTAPGGTAPSGTVPTGTIPAGGLPQTGQLNWPIPVLALTGCVLILIGLACRRKNDYDK